jgi:MOSC domain-containing protein YiiM
VDYSFPATADRELTARFELKHYTLTYTAGTGGVIQGDGSQSVAHGENGTPVMAVANLGYYFVQWSDGLETATREDVNVTGPWAVEALFGINHYALNASASPPEGGSVFGAGTYAHGTEASLSAVPSPGYDFVGWIENGQVVSTEAAHSFPITSSRDLAARFDLKRYTLTYTAETGGAIQGAAFQTVTHGGSGTAVVAVPEEGYRFIKWSDGLQTATREDVTVTGFLAVEARFAILEYTVSLSAEPPEGGTVFGGGTHRHETEASLSAVPNPGYDFVAWMENDQTVFGGAVYVFTATADRELIALFELKRYTLTYTAQTGGAIEGDTLQTVNHGGSGTAVVAVPDQGYHFVQWTDGLQTATREDVNVAGGLAVEANFAINAYTLSLSASPPEGGTVFGGGVHPHGAEVSLSAVPNAGYAFVGWIENEQEVFDGKAYVFAATVDRALIARFELKRYTLTYTATPGGSIQGDEIQSIAHGKTGTAVVALPDEGYHFVRWSDGVLTPTREDENVIAGLTVEATFAINAYTLSLSASPPEGGTVWGGGVHPHGTAVSLSAVPNAAYNFVGWVENEQEVFSDAAYEFTATADRALIARFELKRYTLTYTAGPGGSIQGDEMQSVTHGETGTAVVALADAGADFDGWSDGFQTATRQDMGGPEDLSVRATFRSSAGVSIDWYTTHGISPGEGQTWTDLDHRDNFGKGMTLRDEYIADTDPADPNSAFRIVAVEPGPPFRIHFEPGSTRRLYTLQSTTGFLSESWTNVPDAAPRPGNGGVDNLEDAEPAASRFYRILVELP